MDQEFRSCLPLLWQQRLDLRDIGDDNQYRVQGIKRCRDDTVLLVNGIPLVIAEYKSYLSSSKDWTEAVHQLHRYQRQAPLILAPNVFCVGCRRRRLPLRHRAVPRRQEGRPRPPRLPRATTL